MTLYKWSQTASADANADPTINWAEGQAPSSVNDSARAMMAATAKYRDDISGAIVTSGTSQAYTISSFQAFDSLADMSGKAIAFTPHTTNGTGPVTLSVDGLGAKFLRTAPNADLLAGVLIQGTPYLAIYNNSDGAFYLQGFYGNPYNVPLAGGMDYWGTTVPNSSFAFPIGQAISRTTYASLFAIMGTTYGSGDGSTTFNLPDKTGRVSAMIEASQNRLPSPFFGGTSTQIGAVGGSASHTLTVGEMPAHTHANTLTDPGHTHIFAGLPPDVIINAGGSFGFTSGVFAAESPPIISPSSTGITINNVSQGGGGAHPVVQPTIICNYVIRIF
jgi:microcystin-dependent protein